MTMTNESWEAAACGAIERKLFNIMMTNDWSNQRFVDDEAKTIWTSMYKNFCEEFPIFPEAKKQWLIEKLLEELPSYPEEKQKWLLEKL